VCLSDWGLSGSRRRYESHCNLAYVAALALARMSSTYLPRSLHTLSLQWGLFTDEQKFKRELKRLGVPPEDAPRFPERNAARVNYLVDKDEGELALVCIGDCSDKHSLEVVALIVHEAVHVWHRHCELIGEDAASKSTEYESYAIQHLTQELLFAYAHQKGLM
jgi:predicted metal-dependent peptidase